jgi:AcrR family transcriptional regulator
MKGGIADKSLRAIAETAGTSHRMLIHHFGSREGLLVELIKAVEQRQRDVLAELISDGGGAERAEQDLRFWEHLRSSELAPLERLFFEVYGQALQGRQWAMPLLDGIVEDWVGPVAETLIADGLDAESARVVARLGVAVTRGLLLDVLATGEDREVDAAMAYFSGLLVRSMKSGRA